MNTREVLNTETIGGPLRAILDQNANVIGVAAPNGRSSNIPAPKRTWAELPPASSANAGVIVWCTDIGDGAMVLSTGTEWVTQANFATDNNGNVTGLVGPGGEVQTLSEAVAVAPLTATGTAKSGACEFRGFVVRAISGTPQTVTIYDATSATGTPIMTVSVTALGTYYWDGDHATVGNGRGGRRINSTGCHVVISGGTSRTIDVMVE